MDRREARIGGKMDFEALERLAKLRYSGVLTEDEFNAQKHYLLAGSPGPNGANPVGRKRLSSAVIAGAVLVLALIAILSFIAMRGIGTSSQDTQSEILAAGTQNGAGPALTAPSPGVVPALPLKRPGSTASKQPATATASAQPAVTCLGRWVYFPRDLQNNVAFSVQVDRNFSYKIQFSDFGRSSGNWMQIGSVGADLRLEDSKQRDTFNLGECGRTAMIMFSDGREFELQRARGDLAQEARRRGVDLSEQDGGE